jgi:hypothetical protein
MPVSLLRLWFVLLGVVGVPALAYAAPANPFRVVV